MVARYVGVLTALQEQVKALSSDGAQCREEMAGISNDFQAFQQCVQTFVDTQVRPTPHTEKEKGRGRASDPGVLCGDRANRWRHGTTRCGRAWTR